MIPILRMGDRILTKRVTGIAQYFSSGIALKLNSRYSHVVPVLSAVKVLDIAWPKPKRVDAAHFLQGDYRVKILRPLRTIKLAAWELAAFRILQQRYDLLSFAGFLTNDGKVQDTRRVNCAEGMLLMDQAGGFLTSCDGRLISPKSYDRLSTPEAELFEVIYEGTP